MPVPCGERDFQEGSRKLPRPAIEAKNKKREIFQRLFALPAKSKGSDLLAIRVRDGTRDQGGSIDESL
jgi:hypothetical protein